MKTIEKIKYGRAIYIAGAVVAAVASSGAGFKWARFFG